MGQKVHPRGFRTGIVKDWLAKWYGDKNYAELLQEDMRIRQEIRAKYSDAGVSTVEIERWSNEVILTVHTARPGVVIGRGGQRVEEIRKSLEEITGRKIRLNIQEIRQPELDAYLVARSVAEQTEHRVSHRRAMKQAVRRARDSGAKGVKITCSGRLAGAEIARRETVKEGRMPLQTIRADIDYGFTEAKTMMGRIGVKVWIYKGDILPPIVEETPPIAAETGVKEKQEIVEVSGVKTDVTTQAGQVPQVPQGTA